MPEISQRAPSLEPLAFVERFRRSYTNFYRLWKKTGAPPGVRLQTPDQEPIDEERFPAPVREALAAFRRSHPDATITFVKYMKTVNGQPTVVIEDERDLPDAEHLLSLSQTVATSSADCLEVIAEVFVARRR
ncbi:MAG TPA: hypothetical protein VMW35_14535 [Myxococcota bacterium]|jgi:hypothetical protein|nr:hypothetical protein [Myxococcota bacterium]